MYRRALAVTPGLKGRFSSGQLSMVRAVIGDDAMMENMSFRQVLVEMDARRVEAAREALHASGMRTYTLGTVVRDVWACRFCKGDEAVGYKTAAALDELVSGLSVPFAMRVTYSGCPGGCAEPVLHDLGVIRTDSGFRIYGGGSGSGLSPRFGVLIEEGISEDVLPAAVGRIIRFYQARGREREPFWLFLERMGVESLPKAVNKYWRLGGMSTH